MYKMPKMSEQPVRSYLSEDDEGNELSDIAINDATRVLSELPTQDELEGLLDQNKKLLELWKSSQAQNKELQLQLNDTTNRLRTSQWERGAKERLEIGLSQSTKNLESMVSHIQREFTYILGPRDVVHIYLFDEERQSLVCCLDDTNNKTGSNSRQINELLLDSGTNVVKSYVSGAVIWSYNNNCMTSNGDDISQSYSSDSNVVGLSTKIHDVLENDVEAMAASIVWIPLQSDANSKCCGVAKIMYSNIPKNVVVGSYSMNDLGRVGQLCQVIGGLCYRHYNLWGSQNSLQLKEEKLESERIEMVNFLRYNWNQLNGMFKLKRELKDLVATNDENMLENISTRVEEHLMALLGKGEYIGLYLPPSDDKDASNMANLNLVHVARQKNVSHSYAKGRDYLNSEELIAIVRYVGATETAWNSSTQPLPSTSSSSITTGSILCVPLIGLKCLGVVCVWRPFDKDKPNSTRVIDELDEHITKTYCNHLASLIENDLLNYHSDLLRKEQAKRSILTCEIISKEFSERLSIFLTKKTFFHQVSAGLKSLVNADAAYLFVSDDLEEKHRKNGNGGNTNELWTISCASQASGELLKLTSQDLSNTVMGEVMHTGKAVTQDEQQCRDDIRCKHIDGVHVRNILCVPLFVHHSRQENDSSTLHAVPSTFLGGVIVFLNKTVNSSILNFVEQDITIAKQASSVIAPLLQAWAHTSKTEDREELILSENHKFQNRISDVTIGSLQLMRAAQSCLIFVSAATTACFAIFGSSCSIELLVESNEIDEKDVTNSFSSSSEFSASSSRKNFNSIAKWRLSEKLGGGELERTKLTAEDKKCFRETVRYGRCDVNDPSITVYLKIKGVGRHLKKNLSSDNDDNSELEDDIDPDEINDEIKNVGCVLKIVCTDKLHEDFNSSEETFLQQLEQTCLTTSKGWIQSVASGNANESAEVNKRKRERRDCEMSNSEQMIATISAFHQISACNTPEALCVAVQNDLSATIPGNAALLLHEPTRPDVLWSAVRSVPQTGSSKMSLENQSHDNHERIHIQISRDNRPHGIIGSVMESGTEIFVPDVKKHRDFQADSDSHNKLSPENMTNSYSVIPMMGKNGAVQSVLQVYPSRGKMTSKKKKRNKFSKAEKHLWKSISKFIHNHVERLNTDKKKEDKLAELTIENDILNKKMQRDHKLLSRCTQAMHRAQSLNYDNDSSSVIFNVQRDLCQAFDFVCSAVFVQLDIDKNEIRTALKSESQQAESNIYMYKVPITSAAVRSLFESEDSLGEVKVVNKLNDICTLLDEIPQISVIPNSKVILCIKSKVIGGTAVFVAVVNQDVVTEDLLSSVKMLCVPVVNAACSTVVTIDMNAKIEETNRNLNIIQRKCRNRNLIHSAMLACKRESSLSNLIIAAKKEAKRLLEVEAVDIFVADVERNVFWTLDTTTNGGIDHREVIIGEGGILGSLNFSLNKKSHGSSKSNGSESGAELHKQVCLISNVRSTLARNECPSHIVEPLSVLMIPITTVDGDLLGAIELTNRKNGHFSHEDQETATKFADHLGYDIKMHQICIKNAKKDKINENKIEEQKLETIDLKNQLNQVNVQYHASSSFSSSLSYIRVAQPSVGIDELNSSSHSITSAFSPVQAMVQLCRSFSGSITNVFGAVSSDFFILNQSGDFTIEYCCQGLVGEGAQIPNIVSHVIRAGDAIFRRKVSTFNGDAIESCWPVVNNDNTIIACVYVIHQSSSIPEQDVIICESVVPNILTVANNFLQDTQVVIETKNSVETLSSKIDSLHIDFDNKVTEIEQLTLRLQVTEMCLTLTKVVSAYSSYDDINSQKNAVNTSIEHVCEKIRDLFGFDQVLVIYGRNSNSENSKLINDLTEMDGILLTHENIQRKSSSVSSRVFVSVDSPLISSSTINLSKSVCMLRSTESIDSGKKSLTINDLREVIGEVVTSGALLSSFGCSSEASIVAGRNNTENQKTSLKSEESTAKGLVLFISSETRLDSFNKDILYDSCSELSQTIGLVIEQYMCKIATKVELNKLSETHRNLQVEKHENEALLQTRTQELDKLSSELANGTSEIKKLQSEIDMMEVHLQNEINDRLQGNAAQALARVLVLWRQSSISWYLNTWHKNVKRIRRQRYCVLRVTAKMHRGVLDSSFYIWKSNIAKKLRHKRLLRRATEAIKQRKLHACFYTWHDKTIEVKCLKRKVKRILIKIEKNSMFSAFNSWISLIQLKKQGRRALKHWLLRNLCGHFNRWVTNTKELIRLRRLSRKCLAKYVKASLVFSFMRWHDYCTNAKKQFVILERFALRWQHLALNRSFGTLFYYSRQRKSTRAKLRNMCDIITRTSNARIRVMWQRWYLNVHFNKERGHRISKICATFVLSKNKRVMTSVLSHFIQNASVRQRVRMLLKRVTKRLESKGLNTFFIRWYQHILHIKLDESQDKFKKIAVELNETKQQIQELYKEKDHDVEISKANFQNTLVKLEEKSQELTVSNEKIKDISNQLTFVKEAHDNLRQDYESMCISNSTLKKTFENELSELKSVGDLIRQEQKKHTTSLERTSDIGESLKNKSEGIKNTLQQLAPQLNEIKKTVRELEYSPMSNSVNSMSIDSKHEEKGQNDFKSHVSLKKQDILRRQVKLLVNNAELEPGALIQKITQLVYAIGAEDEDVKSLTKQMFAYVLEIMALRRNGMESLKSHLQHLQDEKLKFNNVSQERRRSSCVLAEQKIHTIVQDVANASKGNHTVSNRLKGYVLSIAKDSNNDLNYQDIMDSLDFLKRNPSRPAELGVLKVLRLYKEKNRELLDQQEQQKEGERHQEKLEKQQLHLIMRQKQEEHERVKKQLEDQLQEQLKREQQIQEQILNEESIKLHQQQQLKRKQNEEMQEKLQQNLQTQLQEQEEHERRQQQLENLILDQLKKQKEIKQQILQQQYDNQKQSQQLQDHELKRIRERSQEILNEIKQLANHLNKELEQSVHQELSALDTELIMADDAQIEIYKYSLKNLLERNNNLSEQRKQDTTFHQEWESKIYDTLISLNEPKLINEAIDSMEKILKEQNLRVISMLKDAKDIQSTEEGYTRYTN